MSDIRQTIFREFSGHLPIRYHKWTGRIYASQGAITMRGIGCASLYLSARWPSPDDNKTPDEFKDAGIALTELHHKEVSPLIQPMWVEKPVQFDINGVTYSGQIDIVDEMVRVRDTKTTGSKPRPESYLFGMTGYAVAARQELGVEEADTILDYLVATKTPYYLPVTAGGPVSDDQIRRFAGTVEKVAEGIEKQQYIPNGLTGRGVCESMCGYKHICPYYMKENR